MNRRQSCTCLLKIKRDAKDAATVTTTTRVLIIIKIFFFAYYFFGIHGMSLSMEQENMCSFKFCIMKS